MNVKTNQLVQASLFLAFGIIIPYIFHATGLAGPIFLPMHMPVLLCGFMLGERYGAIVGFVTPLLNSVLTGMPPIYPTGLAMALELCTYGFVSGYMYKNKKNNVIISLVIAMVIGRIVSGISNYILFFMAGNKYMLPMFLTTAFVKPIWGIVIQLISIPVIIKLIESMKGKNI